MSGVIRQFNFRFLMLAGGIAAVMLLAGCETSSVYENRYARYYDACDQQAGQCYTRCLQWAEGSVDRTQCQSDCSARVDRCFADIGDRISRDETLRYAYTPAPWYGRYGYWRPGYGYIYGPHGYPYSYYRYSKPGYGYGYSYDDYYDRRYRYERDWDRSNDRNRKYDGDRDRDRDYDRGRDHGDDRGRDNGGRDNGGGNNDRGDRNTRPPRPSDPPPAKPRLPKDPPPATSGPGNRQPQLRPPSKE